MRRSNVYENQINWLFRSARFIYPDCRLVIITDQETHFSDSIGEDLHGAVEIFRGRAPGCGAMLSRALSQVKWIEDEEMRKMPQDAPVFLLDSDMSINGPLEAQSTTNYDIVLTYRSRAKMPINGGLFVIAPGSRAQALAFSQQVVKIYLD